jgi:RNA-directed DNA polymerase
MKTSDRRELESGAASKANPERRTQRNMLEQILTRTNLQRAWKRVRQNQGAPGIDGVSIDEFPEQVRKHWSEIKRSILEGSYKPSPVKRVEIPKRSGGRRPLGIPTVLDRLITTAGD